MSGGKASGGLFRGLTVLLDRRDEVADEIRGVAAQALNDAARELLRVANETVPREEGILQDSGTVIDATPEKLVATVAYGGEAGAYAARQHEETTWRHAPGRRAKWLEMAAKEDGPRVMEWVAKTMKGELS